MARRTPEWMTRRTPECSGQSGFPPEGKDKLCLQLTKPASSPGLCQENHHQKCLHHHVCGSLNPLCFCWNCQGRTWRLRCANSKALWDQLSGVTTIWNQTLKKPPRRKLQYTFASGHLLSEKIHDIRASTTLIFLPTFLSFLVAKEKTPSVS